MSQNSIAPFDSAARARIQEFTSCIRAFASSVAVLYGMIVAAISGIPAASAASYIAASSRSTDSALRP